MEITLKKWEKNGMKRIYINSPALDGTKIWFQANPEGKLSEKRGEIFNTNERYFADKAIEEAYKFLQEKTGPWDLESPDFDKVFAAF
jgi:hypothetical protein